MGEDVIWEKERGRQKIVKEINWTMARGWLGLGSNVEEERRWWKVWAEE